MGEDAAVGRRFPTLLRFRKGRPFMSWMVCCIAETSIRIDVPKSDSSWDFSETTSSANFAALFVDDDFSMSAVASDILSPMAAGGVIADFAGVGGVFSGLLRTGRFCVFPGKGKGGKQLL